jgi:hypothetical protein
MHLSNFPGVLLITILFVSCNNENSARTGTRQQLSIPRDNLRYDSAFLSPVNPNNGSAATNALTATSQKSGSSTLDSAAIMLQKGLNPPHGTPGHRCELKVGEPLNSKPEAVVNNSGLNPAHGQPGHRCDIAVGAPLNSKPANSVTATPLQVNTSRPVPATQNGLNPAHGQPGHRCDIAVGAPLNSKPNNTVAPENIDTSKTVATLSTDSVKN